MLPEISLPVGAHEAAHNTPSDETWFVTTPYDQTLAMLKAQLPFGQTFRGMPWCVGVDGLEFMRWIWRTDTEALSVYLRAPGVSGPDQVVIFARGAVKDGNGREGCATPALASASAEPPQGPAATPSAGANTAPFSHSDKAEVDLPQGSRLLPPIPNRCGLTASIGATRSRSPTWSHGSGRGCRWGNRFTGSRGVMLRR